MCYSFRTSIVSYSLGIASALFAFATRQYILGMLILFYCQMQLSEAMVWKGLDENNIELNRKGTAYGKYLLPSHLFGIGLGFILAIYLIQKKKLQLVHLIPLMIGIVFYLLILYGPYRNEHYQDVTYPADRSCVDKSCQNNGNRLKWPFPHSWYIYGFILCLIFLFVFVKPIGSKIYIAGMFTVSLILSWIIFPHSVGSFWCFSAAILAPLLVVGNYLIIRNKNNASILV